MIGVAVKVVAKIGPWKRIVGDLKQGRGAFWVNIRKLWSIRYSAFLRRRFQKLSTSGGGSEWADLSASTKQSRRGPRKGHSGSRSFSVLTDTGLLKKALSVGASGNVNKKLKHGIRFGIGGPGTHKEGKLTIGQLAVIHQKGNIAGGLPARPIVVLPDSKTKRALRNDMYRALKAAGF